MKKFKTTLGSIFSSRALFSSIKMPYAKAKRNAFTMMELIFVIVIIGLLSTFGVEFMVQSYQSYLFSSINNRLQNESATAVEFISKRLSHRIKDSVIARDLTAGTFTSIQDVTTTAGANYTVLAWVGSDIDGWRGDGNISIIKPNWSGVIDLDADIAQNLRITSPETNTSAIESLVSTLSYANSGVDTSAIYFIGANSNVDVDYGWSGNLAYMNDQNGSMHPINDNPFIPTELVAPTTSFDKVDVYEYYKLAWSAYAIEFSPATGDLELIYNYQPWAGERFDTGGQNIQRVLIMQNVSTFQFKAIGSLIKIQVCVESKLAGQGYAICKEKTIY